MGFPKFRYRLIIHARDALDNRLATKIRFPLQA